MASWCQAGAVVLYFALFVHVLTSGVVGPLDLAISLGMVLVGLVVISNPLWRRYPQLRRICQVLTILGSGFWMFTALRYVGVVTWPLALVPDLGAYAFLFYSHSVLAVIMLASVLWALCIVKSPHAICWGDWGRFGRVGRVVLISSAAVFCGLALVIMTRTRPSASGCIAAFATIAFLKALLSATVEEACYRGIIQSAATAHFGVAGGIALQACVYTAFHMHLGEAFFTRAEFLAAVMIMGLVFGAATHLTAGIGWSCVMHCAANMSVIEWLNLSSTS